MLCLLSRETPRLDRWSRLLSDHGWPVEQACDPAAALALAEDARLGLGLMDLALAGADQLSALKKRAPHFVWIVVGTDHPSSTVEAARCLEDGAEDYLPPDLDDRIFAAKMRQHLRRLLPAYAGMLQLLQDAEGSLRVDRAKHLVELKGPRGRWSPLPGLTPTEMKLLCYFLERPELALAREAILENIWQERAVDVNPETLDRHVESLRKKLGKHGKRIESVYGVGYVFRGG